MLSAFQAIKKYNERTDLQVERIDLWNRECDFDIAHFWGLELANYNNIFWAKKSGVKVVLTALLGYMEGPVAQAKHMVAKYIGPGKRIHQLVQLVDCLVVVNDMQKTIAIKYYGFNEDRVHVVPNCISEKFFTSMQASETKPNDKYVLCTGNICIRKNQLVLVHACIQSQTNLVLVGKVLDGEAEYGNMIAELVEKHHNITWIKGLNEHSDELVRLIKNCACFALVSTSENQPISLLEAAASQKPLIISDRAFAKQTFFENAYLVSPASVADISVAIKSVLDNPSKYITSPEIMGACTERAIAMGYIDTYNYVYAGGK